MPTPDGERVPLAGRRYGVYVVPPVLGPFPFPCFPNWSPSVFLGYIFSCGLGVCACGLEVCACEDGVVGFRVFVYVRKRGKFVCVRVRGVSRDNFESLFLCKRFLMLP